MLRSDVTVVGAGAAGLYTALVAANAGARVTLISRSALAESASYWAQGGIAAALAADDSVDRHLTDTLAAGRGSARVSAARVLCQEAPERIRELADLGIAFDVNDSGGFLLGLEGGHATRRVAHAGGSETGRRITQRLSELVIADERIEVLERTTASELWQAGERCVGIAAERASGQRISVLSAATVLATGGAAALWERTTNPPGAIGGGLTLALATGAALADLELVQFHPTALVSDSGLDGFLITEAIRGEGAVLLNGAGERFVDELAPRDQVSLAIEHVMEAGRNGRAAVMLDMRAVALNRFSNVVETLRRAELDPRRDLVPVAPAAHYTMGGIVTDLDGRSSIGGLYAVGECACTGLHGANRLASNSLAECLVFGRRAASAALGEPAPVTEPGLPPAAAPSPPPTRATRNALWRLAGIERTPEGLSELLRDESPLARSIAASALARAESRGAHQRRDRPDADPSLDAMHAVVGNDSTPAFELWR